MQTASWTAQSILKGRKPASQGGCVGASNWGETHREAKGAGITLRFQPRGDYVGYCFIGIHTRLVHVRCFSIYATFVRRLGQGVGFEGKLKASPLHITGFPLEPLVLSEGIYTC